MPVKQGNTAMRNIVAIFAGIGLMLAAFAGLAVALLLGTVAAATFAFARLTGRVQPAMARASAPRQGDRSRTDFRVWNDGRGTIIDM